VCETSRAKTSEATPAEIASRSRLRTTFHSLPWRGERSSHASAAVGSLAGEARARQDECVRLSLGRVALARDASHGRSRRQQQR
jgi:hypothetical protein